MLALLIVDDLFAITVCVWILVELSKSFLEIDVLLLVFGAQLLEIESRNLRGLEPSSARVLRPVLLAGALSTETLFVPLLVLVGYLFNIKHQVESVGPLGVFPLLQAALGSDSLLAALLFGLHAISLELELWTGGLRWLVLAGLELELAGSED